MFIRSIISILNEQGNLLHKLLFRNLLKVGVTSQRIQHLSNKETSVTVKGIKQIEKGISINFSTNSKHSFNYIWLRDHCRCKQCYNHTTYQRVYETHQIPLDIKPKSVTNNGIEVKITWPDDHVTLFDASWLVENHYGKPTHTFVIRPEERKFWGSEMKDNVLKGVDFGKVLKSDKSLYELLKNLTIYGFAFVSNTPTTEEDLIKVAERIGPLRQSHYGRTWKLTNTNETNLEFLDSSYLNVPLPGHTDGTYFHDPPGLQFFHIHKHDGTGGESLLVDGIHAAEQLRNSDPASFEFLSTTSIPGINYDPKYFARGFAPMIRIDPVSKQVFQIRINDLDRDVLTNLSYDNVSKFYEANAKFTERLRDPANELWYRLTPGNLLITHNWRVLHGRAGFTGSRTLAGCYINHDNYLSKMRLLQDEFGW